MEQQDNRGKMQTVSGVLKAIGSLSKTHSPVVKNVGEAAKLLTTYNPDKQSAWCMHHRGRMFYGDAPLLSKVSEQYGDNVAKSWLQVQLADLNEFSGAQTKMTPRQIDQVAGLILENHSNYKLTELMVFFHDYKSGKYGTFYGAVDPLRIMEALRDFWRVQACELYAHNEEIRRFEREAYEREVAAKSELLMQQLGERVASGDQDALRLLCKIEDYAKVNKS